VRHLLSLTLLLPVAGLSLSCAAGAPTATLSTFSVPDTPAATALTQAPARPVVERSTTALSSTQSVVERTAPAVPATPVAPQSQEEALSVPLAPVDEEAIPEAPAFDVGAINVESMRRLEAAGGDAQSILDPWRPYGLGVVRKTATTVTLAWRTDLEAKAIVYFGKTFGLSRRGYDGVIHVNKSAKVQQVTLEGLSRFRSYTFTVVGLGPLTMQFPSYPLKTRTNLF